VADLTLFVCIGDQMVGHLHHASGSNAFDLEYTPVWRKAAGAFDLSPALPRDSLHTLPAEVRSQRARNYFENLLPEGRVLEEVAHAHNLSPANVAGLLAVLGKEAAGAVRFVGEMGEPEPGHPLRPLARDEVSQRIRAREHIPFAVWDNKVRVSIAGAQDKLAVYQADNGEWFLAEGGRYASTHILKPEPRDRRFPGMVANEFFCMQLAHHVGLPVAAVRMVFMPEPVLVVERYDRIRLADRVRRLSVIDGCQLLDLPPSAKYERPYDDGRDVRHIRTGASLPKLFEVMAGAPRPLSEKRALLRWVIFQILIGNTDAHGKNLTFFLDRGGFRMAPMYDLLCMTPYKENGGIDDTYAMAVGDAFTPEALLPYQWANFANKCGLPAKLVERDVAQMCNAVEKTLALAELEVAHRGGDVGMATLIANVVRTECGRQMLGAQEIIRATKYAQ